MSKPLIPAQRREKIQEYLAIHQIARTVDLCELLDTSEATVRRDLEWLEQEGFLERTHGGAILNRHMTFEPEYMQRAQNYTEGKKLDQLVTGDRLDSSAIKSLVAHDTESLLAVTHPIPA
jgi:DeoR/GlpR family transcriptional regulator of sugar metabolism